MTSTTSAPAPRPLHDRPAPPLVVAVDGGRNSDAALDWAAAEATALGCPLHLVHVRPVDTTWPAVGIGSPVPPADDDDVLRQGLERVRAAGVGTEAVLRSVGGDVGHQLVRASTEATAVVVGAPRHGVVGQAFLGSVAMSVAGHAHCPVAVVRAATRRGAPSEGVVAGIDGSSSDAAVLQLALQRARRTGLPLSIVHAWTTDYVPPSPRTADVEPAVRRSERRASAVVDAAVARLGVAGTGVEVREQIADGDPVSALVRASASAESLVVGTRGLSPRGGLLMGSVSQALVRRSLSPLLVVRAAGEHPGE